MSTTTPEAQQKETTTSPQHHRNNLTKDSLLEQRARDILAQDRHVLNFEHYRPGTAHAQRLARLSAVDLPDVFADPAIAPRSRWFTHPRYRVNSQMPPFHVHFRVEMQRVVSCLWEAATATSRRRRRHELPHRARRLFQGSLRGLHGHVRIEEYACFPLYQRAFPTVDLQFLVDDHRALHRAETRVEEMLSRCCGDPQQKDDEDGDEVIWSTLETVLDFDDHLMAHLGEEEEIVVPLSLTEKPIHF